MNRICAGALGALLLVLVAAQISMARPAEGILLVAFGTSLPEARKGIDNIEKSFRKAFPGSPVELAFTSGIIRRKLAGQGMPVPGIGEALARLARRGVKTVRVQSLHMLAGEEFSAMERSVLAHVLAHPGQFSAVYLGRPLLESREDARQAARVILGSLCAGPERGALVLMGHGQEKGRADLVFEGTRAEFREKDPHVYMATVEGARRFDDLLADLEAAKVKKVCLAPLMLVAGEHARNDLGGEADSWASRLRARGFRVEMDLVGLGEIEGIASLFVQHAKEARDDLTKEPRKP